MQSTETLRRGIADAGMHLRNFTLPWDSNPREMPPEVAAAAMALSERIGAMRQQLAAIEAQEEERAAALT